MNEYQAHNHGHGTGWSWEVAKGRGKMHDIIEAQRLDWDEKVDHLARCCPRSKSERVFDPGATSGSGRGARSQTLLCLFQMDLALARSRPDLYRPRRDVFLSGTADDVQHLVKHLIAGTLTGAGRVLEVVGPQDFVDLVSRYCTALGGGLLECRVDQETGRVVEARYQFPDKSELSVDAEGLS